MFFNPISSFAVEIEGMIPSAKAPLRDHLYYYQAEWTHDGSIRVPDSREYMAIEIKKPFIVLKNDKFSDMIQALEAFARFVWEDLEFKQNESCGNHLHIKFRRYGRRSVLNLMRFAGPIYLSSYLMKYYTNNKYVSRLTNQYSRCNRFEMVDAQAGSRYYAINTLSLSKYSTVEFRIMPYAESWEEFVEMHKFTLEFWYNLFNGGIEIDLNKISTVSLFEI